MRFLILGAAMLISAPALARPAALVFPFEMLSLDPQHQWIGRAIQQSLLVEGVGLQPPETAPATAPTFLAPGRALEMGRAAGAQVIVLGSYQVLADRIRVTGQVMDVHDQAPIATLKAQGPLSGLFEVQDDLAAQLERHLRREVATEPSIKATPTAQAPVTPAWQSAEPVQVMREQIPSDQLPIAWQPDRSSRQSAWDRYRMGSLGPCQYPPYWASPAWRRCP